MEIILDGNRLENQTDFYQQMGYFLSYPDYFGYNLDALYDILTSLPSPIYINIIHKERLQQRLGSIFYKKMLQLFQNSGAFVNFL